MVLGCLAFLPTVAVASSGHSDPHLADEPHAEIQRSIQPANRDAFYTVDASDYWEEAAQNRHNIVVGRCGQREPLWPDEFSGCQQLLKQAGAGSLGVNAEKSWETTLGEGITVLVVDYPPDFTHSDLADNVDLSRSLGLTGAYSPGSPYSHGTAMASIIAARDNDVGMRGIAPRADIIWKGITSFAERWYIDKNDPAGLNGVLLSSDAATMQAAVINHSYSSTNRSRPWKVSETWREIHELPGPCPQGLERLCESLRRAASRYGPPGYYGAGENRIFDALSERGFGGLGAVNVVSGGKTERVPEIGYSTLSEVRNHPALVVACSVDGSGRRWSWGNTSLRGPNLWTCAYADGSLEAANGNRYAFIRGGASSPVTAMVSGVAALVRAANPGLTWRDVKLILAETAQHNDPQSSGWQESGKRYSDPDDRYRYHHSYGFGVIDAGAAVQLALDWIALPAYLKESQASSMTSSVIPDDGSELTDTIEAESSIDFIEYVEAEIDFAAPWFRDLRVELVSPSGTTSVLSESMDRIKNPYRYELDCDRRDICGISGPFRFGSSVHLGETGSGTWRLRVVDEKENNHVNTLNSWKLNLFGHTREAGLPLASRDSNQPVITVSGGSSVIEGAQASFTVSSSPAPNSDLSVRVKVSDAPNADFVDARNEGVMTVTVPPSGSVSLNVETAADGNDEPSGDVIVRVLPGAGYGRGQSAALPAAAVFVADDDITAVTLSGADGSVRENNSKKVKVTLGRYLQAGEKLAVPLSLAGTASLGADYTLSGAEAAGVSYQNLDGTSPTVTFTGRSLLAATITVAAEADWVEDPAETLDIGLGSLGATSGIGLGGGAVGTDSLASFTIVDVPHPLDDGTPPVVGFDDAHASEGDALEFLLSLSKPAKTPVRLLYITLEASASTSDFAFANEYVTFAPGETEKTVSVATFADSLAEDDEAMFVEIVEVEGAVAGTALGIGTISDKKDSPPDEPEPAIPVVTITGGSTVAEGDDAKFTVVSSSAPSADLVVVVGVAETGDILDAGGSGRRSVTIAASATTGELAVGTDDDDLDEPDGEVRATLVAADGYTIGTQSSASVVVSDDDVPVVTVAAGEPIVEGETAIFSLTANPAPASPLPVRVTVSQQGDFLPAGELGSKTVTIPAGSGSVAVMVKSHAVGTIDDQVAEKGGSVSLKLVPDAEYSVGAEASATLTVSDNDLAAVSIAAPSSSVIEGESIWFEIIADPLPVEWGDMRINVELTESGDFGAAAPGVVPGFLTVLPKGRTFLEVETANDLLAEPDGSVTASIVGGDGYVVGSSASATVLVSDNDAAIAAGPVVEVNALRNAVIEGDAAEFMVTAVPAPSAPLTVTIEVTTLGEMNDGIETGRRSFAIPESGSATISLATDDDSIHTAEHGTAAVTLEAGTAYRVGASNYSRVSVFDDDAPGLDFLPAVSITANGAVNEGSPAEFALAADKAAPFDVAVTVSVKVYDGEGVLMSKALRQATIPSGSRSATLTIPTTDNEVEATGDGKVSAEIVRGDRLDYRVRDPRSGTVTVTDDEGPLKVAVSEAAAVEGEPMVFTVTRSSAAGALTVYYRSISRSANTADFRQANSRLLFGPGETVKTIEVETFEDNLAETSEEMEMVVMWLDGSQLESRRATGTITDS
ncbi:MAG: proprotein convertase P-domain-containing protein [bacterium]|nr:proprotein convertase P-domain-containing protein [bacterium]